MLLYLLLVHRLEFYLNCPESPAMARQPPKCCCCVPLRPGLLAWAYIKLVLALTCLGVWVHVTRYAMVHYLDLELSVLLLYLVFTIVFIIGVHLQNFKLLLVFLVYSIFEVILGAAAFGWQLYELVRNISFYRNLYSDESDVYLESHLYEPVFYLRFVFPLVVNMLLPIYFIVLIKSEVQRLKSARRETCVVLDKPVTEEQDKTCNLVYSDETPDRRKPLFPVEELERLRQELGVMDV